MFGKALKQYRKKHNLTQRSLSRISGVDRDVISRIERGTENADTETQGRIVNAVLRNKSHFRPENAHGFERGEQLGLFLSTLSDGMAEEVYVDIINKLREYVGFQIDVDISTKPPYPVKRKRKHVQNRF